MKVDTLRFREPIEMKPKGNSTCVDELREMPHVFSNPSTVVLRGGSF
jgi:hypothetical protein